MTDIGGLNDHGFNHLAYIGLLRAEKELGVQGRVLTSSTGADYLPNLTTLAHGGYHLIIPVGFLMAQATDQVAKGFPSSKFAMVDSDATAEPGDPKNIEGLLFEEQQAGYLAGYLSGLYAKSKGYKTISSVGGEKIPPVDHYIAGYIAGAKAASPKAKVLYGYSQDFVDQAKCKEVALNQIAQGSQVEFQVAGQCGLGALDAAKEKGGWGIGVDADQAYLGAHMLTSATKKVDAGVLRTIKMVNDGNFHGYGNTTFSVRAGGVGIGKISPKVPKAIVAQEKVLEKKLASGKVKGIPTTVP